MNSIMNLLSAKSTTFEELYDSIKESLGDPIKYAVLSKDEIALLYAKLNGIVRYLNDTNYNIGKFNDFIMYTEDKDTTISKLKVTAISGKTFDGDEKSQDRMLRAIQIADITGLTTTEWKLADNSIVMVTLDELKEALALSGQEMSRIWLEQ